MVFIHGLVVTSTKAIIKTTFVVDMEKCIGKMAAFIEATGN